MGCPYSPEGTSNKNHPPAAPPSCWRWHCLCLAQLRRVLPAFFFPPGRTQPYKVKLLMWSWISGSVPGRTLALCSHLTCFYLSRRDLFTYWDYSNYICNTKPKLLLRGGAGAGLRYLVQPRRTTPALHSPCLPSFLFCPTRAPAMPIPASCVASCPPCWLLGGDGTQGRPVPGCADKCAFSSWVWLVRPVPLLPAWRHAGGSRTGSGSTLCFADSDFSDWTTG